MDLRYYGKQGTLEYDFIVEPGADPNGIRFAYEGAEGLEIDSRGDLTLATGGGVLHQKKPTIYQEKDGERILIAGAYRRIANNQFGFEVDEYDPNQPLIIDPLLDYGSYLGGTENDSGNALLPAQ